MKALSAGDENSLFRRFGQFLAIEIIETNARHAVLGYYIAVEERQRDREDRHFLRSSVFVRKLCRKYFSHIGAAYCYSTKIRILE
jgi:hypothetical protein